MLIYVTNRNLPKLSSSNPTNLSVSKIGQTLSKSNTSHDVIISGIASKNYKNIKFYPRGKETDLFDSISDDDLKKPWLVLLHGFHQDPAETIEKAQKLYEIYGVNVVLFSWPSRPKPVKAFSSESVDKIVKSSISSLLMGTKKLAIGKYLIVETKKAISDLKGNYLPARENARKSTNDFYAALELVNAYLVPKIGVSKISLFVHSMGNYLLQNTMKDKKGLPMSFQNIICHQADVKSSNHASWVSGLYGYSKGKLYVTVNVFDYALAASNVLNKLNGEKNTERLGQSVKLKPEGMHQGYIQGLASYIDLTDAVGVDSKHEIFTETADNIDPVIVELFGRLFRSEKTDKLPTKKDSVKSGFRMMPTLPKVYKPQWILEDEALCEPDYNNDCLISSLQYFEDPFKVEPDYDPDLDEDY